jgi:acyl carrier protein
MTDTELADLVRQALSRVAPETAGVTLEPATPLRDQLDLDSMDMLQFVLALHRACGVAIPERDYPQLATLAGAIRYLGARLP